MNGGVLRPWGLDTAGVLSFLAAMPERHPGIRLRLLLGGQNPSHLSSIPAVLSVKTPSSSRRVTSWNPRGKGLNLISAQN